MPIKRVRVGKNLKMRSNRQYVSIEKVQNYADVIHKLVLIWIQFSDISYSEIMPNFCRIGNMSFFSVT